MPFQALRVVDFGVESPKDLPLAPFMAKVSPFSSFPSLWWLFCYCVCLFIFFMCFTHVGLLVRSILGLASLDLHVYKIVTTFVI